MVSIHSGALFSPKEEWNYVIFWEMDVTGDHQSEQNKLDSSDKHHIFSSPWMADLLQLHQIIEIWQQSRWDTGRREEG